MKKVLKFKFQDQEGFLSVVEKSGFYYALVKKDTPKVASILDKHRLLISYELKNPKYQEVLAHVIYEETHIEWVYHTLEAENNLYYKALDSSLCVLEIEMNKD